MTLTESVQTVVLYLKFVFNITQFSGTLRVQVASDTGDRQSGSQIPHLYHVATSSFIHMCVLAVSFQTIPIQ